jgi:hypothetical protein
MTPIAHAVHMEGSLDASFAEAPNLASGRMPSTATTNMTRCAMWANVC